MKIKSFLIYIIITALAVSISASEKFKIGGIDGLDPTNEQQTYPVLLALSGGGARGLSIIGILKAFEEKNIKVVGIAGTSMGGIIGGLYASGYSPYEIERFAEELNFSTLFTNAPPRNSMFLTKRTGNEKHLFSIRFNKFRPVFPKALTTGQKLTSLLTELTTAANYKCKSDFSKLPIPFLTVSTDIVSGEEVIIRKGSIAEAMRSSMAFPLAFTGIEEGGRILMDGGMVNPIPVELARTVSDKSQFVVAINTSSKLAKKEEIKDPIDIANQVTSIMTADKLNDQLSKADYILEPPIDSYLSSHFDMKDSLIQIGYRYGLEQSDKIISELEKIQTATTFVISKVQSSSLKPTEIGFLNEKFDGHMFSKESLINILKDFVNTYYYFQLDVNFIPDSDSTVTQFYMLSVEGYKNIESDKLQLQFLGNTMYSDAELASLFPIIPGLVTSDIIKSGLENITTLYQNNKFDLANIKNVSIDFQNSKIVIEIDEAHVKSIDILENIVTKDWFIRSYFPLKKDELYSTSEALEGIRNIYGTDIFERVTLDVIHADNGVIVQIRVKEKHTSRVRVGWHWDDFYETEEFVELLNDNFGGIGLEYKLHAQYAPRRKNYFFSLKADRIFKTYLTSQIKIYSDDINRHTYNASYEHDGYIDETTNGFKLTLGQQIERLGAVTASLSIEEVEIYDSKIQMTDSFGLRKIILESLFENFDKLPFPRSGNRHLFSIEFAGKYVGGDVEFTKFYTSHESYLPLGNYFTYHPHFALGASRSGLPLSEKFYLGGYYSFIGFNSDQLSGDKMFIFSNELQYNLPFNFYLTFRYDLGEVYNSFDQIKLKNLRNSVGISLSLDTPIGPFIFGYGYANEYQEEIYTHVGFNF